jgi:WD40 repeat protein
MISPSAIGEHAGVQGKAGGAQPGPYRYEAFISYSHAADGRLAPFIERRLRRFAKSFWQSSTPVFRDETTLALTPHLWPTIRERIDQSRTFVLLASPEAAASHWVAQEVSYWLEKRGPDDLYIVLTSGTIAWDQQASDFDWARTDSLPHALKRAFAFEPRWENALALKSAKDLAGRNPVLERIVASLYAAITGQPLEDVIGEEVQRRRGNRAVTAAAATLVAAGALASLYWYLENQETALRLGRQQAATGLSRAWLAQDQPEAAAAVLAEGLDLDPSITSRELRWSLLNALHASRESAILQHDAALGRVSLSRDGRRLVTASKRAAHVWDALEPAAPSSIESSADLVSVELSPDAARLLTASKDNVVRVWALTAAGGNEVQRLALDARPRLALLDRDGARVAVLDANGVACIWHLAETTPSCAVRIEATSSKLTEIRWSPDATALVGVARDGSVRIWSADTGQQTAHIELGAPAAGFDWEIAIDTQGRRAVTWVTREADRPESEREAGALWDLEQRRLVRRLEIEGARWIAGAVFGPDGRQLALRTRDRARILDAASGETTAYLIGHTIYIRDLRFSPDGASIATASYDHTVRVWDARTGQSLHVLNGHSDRAIQAAFSPDGCRLVSVSDDETARIWSLAAGAWHRRLSETPCEGNARKTDTPEMVTNSASFNRTGTLLATASTDRHARIWDVPTGARRQLLPRQPQNVLATAFSPDERLLAVGEGSLERPRTPSEVRLYDWRSGTEVAKLRVEGRARALQFSPDGRSLLAAIGDGTAAVMRLGDGDRLSLHATLAHGTNPVTSAAWSADGRRVATTSTDHQICVFALPSGEDGGRKPDRSCRKLAYDVFDAAWSHNGDQLAAVDGDANVVMWDTGRLDTDKERRFRLLDGRWGVDVAFTADDGELVVRLNDGTILVRDIALGRDRYELRSPILTTGFAVSPDGTHLATTHFDGSARILPLTPSMNDLVRLVKAGLPRCLTELQRQRYGTITDRLQNPAWCKDKWPDDKATRVFRTRPPNL